MHSDSGQLSGQFLDAAVELMGRAGRGGTVQVRGRSMVPSLHEGQTLAVEFSPEGLEPGDLLVFRMQGGLVVHRMLGRARFPDGRRSLRTRGDGTPTLDPHVHESQVVGRVIALQSGSEWRSTRTRAARVYARAIAWHDFVWAAGGVSARWAERALASLRLRAPLRRWVAAMDRRLLRWAHRGLFRRAHRVVPPPAEAGEARSDGGP